MRQDGLYAVSPENYNLPVTDVDTEKRNFPGYHEYELEATWDTEGTTETDSVTDPGGEGGYTKINRNQGMSVPRGGQQLSIGPMPAGLF